MNHLRDNHLCGATDIAKLVDITSIYFDDCGVYVVLVCVYMAVLGLKPAYTWGATWRQHKEYQKLPEKMDNSSKSAHLWPNGADILTQHQSQDFPHGVEWRLTQFEAWHQWPTHSTPAAQLDTTFQNLAACRWPSVVRLGALRPLRWPAQISNVHSSRPEFAGEIQPKNLGHHSHRRYM